MILSNILEFILHLDVHLASLVQNYGILVYILIFLMIFCETGLVVLPFLPGDSLIFAAGALAATGSLNVTILFTILFLAAVCGDTINYWIGSKLGPHLAKSKHIRFVKEEHLEKTKQFYAKYGNKTIVLARFVPIVRTFAPFVAGVGTMKYSQFIVYNILGGFLWVGLFIFGGFLFGNIPVVKENFSLVILGIILASFIPVVIEIVKHKKEKRKINIG